MRNKLVVGYRATNNHLGQMMEGYWKRLPEKYKAVSLDELSDTFKNLRKKLKLDLSIVIRCSDDERIKDCLDSIDASVDETVVVLNGASNKVKNIVGTYDVKKVEIEERNMSLAQNTGIESARNDKVLLVDSDCVLGKSAIHRLYSSLDNYAIIKGKVVFRSKGILSGIVSNIRNYHDSHEIKAYTPMLLIRKSIKESIGGYFFNRSIQWTDDDDFDKRVKEAGIRIKYVPNAVCYHDNENICSSLRGAFGYGKGLYNQIENSSQKFVVLDRIADTLRKSLSILQDYGIPTALYYTLFWKPIYFVGYYKEKTKKLMMRW